MTKYAIELPPPRKHTAVLPGGKITSVGDAKVKGFTVAHLNDAQALSIDLGPYRLTPGQQSSRRETVARVERGQTARMDTTHAERLQVMQDEKVSAELAYFVALMKLPEATGRIAAVHKLAACHNAKSMPVERAALMLAALPLDVAAPASISRTTAAQEGVLKRKAEIRHAALSQRVGAGDFASRDEMNAIAYALKLHNGQGMRMSEALEQCNVEL